MYIYTYVYTYIYTYIYICVFTYLVRMEHTFSEHHIKTWKCPASPLPLFGQRSFAQSANVYPLAGGQPRRSCWDSSPAI